MCKGQAVFLLGIPQNNHVLDTGQINWAGWKPARLLMARSCSMAMAVANSRGRQRKARTAAIFLNLFLLCFVLPIPSQRSVPAVKRKVVQQS